MVTQMVLEMINTPSQSNGTEVKEIDFLFYLINSISGPKLSVIYGWMMFSVVVTFIECCVTITSFPKDIEIFVSAPVS